jgi:hypothetical protein
MITTFEQYLYENNDDLPPVEVARLYKVLRNMGNQENPNALFCDIMTQYGRYLKIHDSHRYTFGGIYYNLLFNLCGVYFRVTIEEKRPSYPWAIDSYCCVSLYITSPDNKIQYTFEDLSDGQKRKILSDIFKQIPATLQDNLSFYYKLPPQLQQKYHDFMKPLGGDFGFFENVHTTTLDVPACIVDTVTAINVYRKSPRLNRDSEDIQNLTQENSPKIIQYLHQHPDQIHITGWLQIDNRWNFQVQFNIETYLFSLDFEHSGFVALFYLDGWHLPVKTPDKILLRNAVKQALQNYIQEHPWRFYDLPPICQEWFRKIMQPTGTDFGFLEAQHNEGQKIRVNDQDQTDLTTFCVQLQEFDKNYDKNRTEILTLINQHQDKIFTILKRNLKHWHIHNIGVWESNEHCPDINFTLWHFNFSILLSSELDFLGFFLDDIVIVNNSRETKPFMITFFKYLHHAIITNPSLFPQLPPKLQHQWAKDFQHHGTDFGFLE